MPIVYQMAGDRLTVNDSSYISNMPLVMNPRTLNDSLVTEGLLLRLTDCDTLEEIRVISLRNKQLSSCLRILSLCIQLNIAYLQGNRLHMQDMMYLQTFSHLKKIDLSHNMIQSLPSAKVFSGLVDLKFLYLHNNRIAKWQEISSLTALPVIIHITLFSNPVCSVPGYRHFLVNSIKPLLALDHFVITDEERIDDVSFGYRFRALNEFMKLHIPDYAIEKSAEQHLFNLEVDIYRLRRIFERNSPSIMIQSVYRGFRERHKASLSMAKKKNLVVLVQKTFRGYMVRRKFKKELLDMLEMTNQQYLMMTNEQLRQRSAGTVIKKFMLKKYREKKRELLELKSAITIQRHFRGRQTRVKSYVDLLQLHEQPWIYILKEQKPLFLKLLKELSDLFEHRFDCRYEDLIVMVKEDDKYETMRVTEPDIFDYKWQPIVQFTKPSALSRIRENKHMESHCFAREDFSLLNMYYKQPEEDHSIARRWNTLQIRNCKVNRQILLSVMDARAKKHAPKNQFVFQDQYRDFLIFKPLSVEMLNITLQYILHYNREANIQAEQLFLVFFEPLLRKISAAAVIQRNWRAHLFRKRMFLRREGNRLIHFYPIEELLEKRAAYCLQRWWSNIRLRKRMHGMERIKNHIDRIQSRQFYIESSIYSNLRKITKMIQTQMRYEEQDFDFDFSLVSKQVCLNVNEVAKCVTRYHALAVPQWYALSFRSIDFGKTQNYNDLLALFHFNETDCAVLPVNYVIDYEQKQLDIDRDLSFIKVKCQSVEEARRRAYVIAALTYDIHQKLFVRVATGEMLQDPFIIQNIYNIRKRFEIDLENFSNPFYGRSLEEKSVKEYFSKQQVQSHQGLILGEKDFGITRFASFGDQIFKTLSLQKQQVAISCQTKHDSLLFDLEIQNNSTRGRPQQISLFETKKLEKQAFKLLKERRTKALNENIKDFRDTKAQVKSLLKLNADRYLEEKREEVNKVREIGKIIQTEQKGELDRNLQVFLGLNREEKILRQELVEKQQEVVYKEKYLKKMNVMQQHRSRQEKKEEKEQFINSFMQAKNLIEKQMKIGKRIREQKIQQQERKAAVDRQKMVQEQQREMSMEKVAVKSVLFDHQMNNSFSLVSQQRQSMLSQNPGLDQSLLSAKLNIKNSESGRQCLLTTMADESLQKSRSRGFAIKSASQANYQSGGAGSQNNRSRFVLPLLNNDSSYIGRNTGRNNINQTFQGSYYKTSTKGNGEGGEVEQIFTYIHDDSRKMHWKRDSTKPVFAEENFPLTRKVKKAIGQIASFQISLDLHNPKNLSKLETDHYHNEGTEAMNSKSTYSQMNTVDQVASQNAQDKRASDRRSLLAKISY